MPQNAAKGVRNLLRDGSMLAGRHLTIANSGRQSAGPLTSRRWSLRSGRTCAGATENPAATPLIQACPA